MIGERFSFLCFFWFIEWHQYFLIISGRSFFLNFTDPPRAEEFPLTGEKGWVWHSLSMCTHRVGSDSDRDWFSVLSLVISSLSEIGDRPLSPMIATLVTGATYVFSTPKPSLCVSTRVGAWEESLGSLFWSWIYTMSSTPMSEKSQYLHSCLTPVQLYLSWFCSQRGEGYDRWSSPQRPTVPFHCIVLVTLRAATFVVKCHKLCVEQSSREEFAFWKMARAKGKEQGGWS